MWKLLLLKLLKPKIKPSPVTWIFFWPTSRKVLPNFQTLCPVGVQIAQTIVCIAYFQVQARKRGVLVWGLRCFVYVLISKRAVWLLSKNRGWGWYSRQNEIQSGQNETYLGNLCKQWGKVLGKKNSIMPCDLKKSTCQKMENLFSSIISQCSGYF